MKSLFESSVEELDVLAQSGDLGKRATLLLEKRKEVTTDEFMYLSFLSIYGEKEFDREIQPFTNEFISLFSEVMLKDASELNKIVTVSIKGSKEHPELETMTSYNRLIKGNVILKKRIRQLSKNQTSQMERIELGDMILRTYSDGFEYVMKLFTFVIALERVAHGLEYNFSKISSLTAAQKLNNFRQIDKGMHTLLADCWDARLRNADSHMDIIFDSKSGTFKGKNHFWEKVNGERVQKNESFEVTIEEMCNDILPKTGQFSQGYMCAVYLTVLVTQNRSLYNKAVKLMEVREAEHY